MTPWPGATTGFAGKRVQIMAARPLHRLECGRQPGEIDGVGPEGMDVACRPGVLRVTRIKAEGKPDMAAADWARGARVQPGDRFVAVESATEGVT